MVPRTNLQSEAIRYVSEFFLESLDALVQFELLVFYGVEASGMLEVFVSQRLILGFEVILMMEFETYNFIFQLHVLFSEVGFDKGDLIPQEVVPLSLRLRQFGSQLIDLSIFPSEIWLWSIQISLQRRPIGLSPRLRISELTLQPFHLLLVSLSFSLELMRILGLQFLNHRQNLLAVLDPVRTTVDRRHTELDARTGALLAATSTARSGVPITLTKRQTHKGHFSVACLGRWGFHI